MDERFKMHRFKSTSHAAVVGAVLMGGWYFYSLVSYDVRRMDILAIMTAMAVTKIAVMIFYRMRD
jgi:hypothetical protein